MGNIFSNISNIAEYAIVGAVILGVALFVTSYFTARSAARGLGRAAQGVSDFASGAGRPLVDAAAGRVALGGLGGGGATAAAEEAAEAAAVV